MSGGCSHRTSRRPSGWAAPRGCSPPSTPSTSGPVPPFHKRSRTSARAPIYFTNYGYLGDGYTNSKGYLRTLPGNHGGLQLSTPDGLNIAAAIDLLPRIKYAMGPALKCVPRGKFSVFFRDPLVD